jgi:hypothetical protein
MTPHPFFPHTVKLELDSFYLESLMQNGTCKWILNIAVRPAGFRQIKNCLFIQNLHSNANWKYAGCERDLDGHRRRRRRQFPDADLGGIGSRRSELCRFEKVSFILIMMYCQIINILIPAKTVFGRTISYSKAVKFKHLSKKRSLILKVETKELCYTKPLCAQCYKNFLRS